MKLSQALKPPTLDTFYGLSWGLILASLFVKVARSGYKELLFLAFILLIIYLVWLIAWIFLCE